MIDIGRGVKLVTRAEWGARAPDSVTSMTPSYGTTVHWEGPHMGDFPHSACDDKVRGIQSYHMDSKGWTDIAYTAVACPHGYLYEGRWVGRRTAANGTSDGNDRAYAICYLGGEGDPFTDEGKVAIRAGLDWLDAHGNAGHNRNGHRDWKATECPGDVIYGWVHSGQPAGSLEDDDDMPSIEEIEKVVRTVLNEGTGKGQANWAATCRATLADGQTNYNKLNELLKDVADLTAKVDALADQDGEC